jgi:putative transcriptional regulator
MVKVGKKKVRIADELAHALGEAITFERGGKLDLRSTKLPDRPRPMKPQEIRAIRKSLKASQVTFARLINVSANAVESWEQGARKPQAAALKLLNVAKKHPKVLLEA